MLTVVPIATVSFGMSMPSMILALCSLSWILPMRPMISPIFSLAEWYSAFSFKSPFSRASPMSSEVCVFCFIKPARSFLSFS